MNRTKTLFNIVLVLLFAIVACLVIPNYEQTLNELKQIINSYKPRSVKIPAVTSNNRNYDFKTFKTTTDFEPENINDLKEIIYTVLNNGWKEFTFYCSDEYKDCYDEVQALAKDTEYISLVNNYVSPYNSYNKYNTMVDSTGMVKLSIDKLYTDAEILTLQTQISKIINDLGIDKNKLLSGDIVKIHNYLINNITYDTEYVEGTSATDSNKAYGALVYGKAVCSGYADAFALFMDELNIPNFKVSSENHVWNVIYFNNKWSHVDITWDDDEVNENNNYNFFMISTHDLFEKDKEEHNYNQELYLEIH